MIDNMIRSNAGKLTGVQMAKQLDCPVQRIYAHAKKLGIKLRLKGEIHPCAKATNHEVELIRQLYEEGIAATDIAEKMEFSISFIYAVVSHQRRAYD